MTERLSKAEVKARIDRAFVELNRVCESRQESARLLAHAHRAALEGERRHRSIGRGLDPGPYQQSVETAARYWVLRWFWEPAKVTSALEAVQLREDALHASALAQFLLNERKPTPELFERIKACGEIDYSEDIVPRQG